MNLKDLIAEWVELYNKSESVLEQYAALRIVGEQVQTLIKQVEKAAVADALEQYASSSNSTVYRKNGLSLHLRFNSSVEFSDELNELNEQIEVLQQQVKEKNAAKIAEAIAHKEKLVKQLEEAEIQIAIFSTSPELEELKDAREKLVRSHSTKRATLVGKYRPI